MKKTIVLLLVSISAFSQRNGLIDADTTTRPKAGLHALAFSAGNLKVIRTSGNSYGVVTTNNTYSNPSWLSAIALAKVTGLQSALDAKANSSHTHTISNVTALQDSLTNKVTKITGKGLSTEDYSTAEKSKLAGIAAGATANSTDAQLRDRSTHTGTQAASTISDFTTASQTVGDARYLPLTGGSVTGTGGAGFFGATAQSASPSTPSNGFRLFANSSNAFAWRGANGYLRVFDGLANTADRTYTLPDASGKLGIATSFVLGVDGNYVYDNFIRPNTMTNDLGNNIWTLRGNNYTGVTQASLVNDYYVSPEGQISYATALSPVNLTKIGMNAMFVAGSGVTDNNSIAMAISPDNTIANMTVHYFSTRIGWALQVVQSGVFTTIASGVYSTPLSLNTLYTFEVIVDGNRAIINSAGVKSETTNDYLTTPAKYCFFEHYYSQPTATTISKIKSVWAGSSQLILPQRLNSTADVNFRSVTLNGTGVDTKLTLNNSGTGGKSWTIFSSDNLAPSLLGTGALNFYDGIAGVTRATLSSTGLGIGTVTPTHSLTLHSTSTGWAQYNTADQTTNFERVRGYWSGNIYNIGTEAGGAGTVRQLNIGTANRQIGILDAANQVGFFQIGSNTSASNASIVGINGISTASAGTYQSLSVLPTINQSSTAGYRGIFVSPYEQTTGSGSKLLLDLGTNSAANGSGTHTSRFSVDNTGNVLIGTTTNVASSLLTLSSTTKGVLLPRMTTAQINAISSPATGLVAYNTDLNTLCFYDGTMWKKVSHSNMN